MRIHFSKSFSLASSSSILCVFFSFTFSSRFCFSCYSGSDLPTTSNHSWLSWPHQIPSTWWPKSFCSCLRGILTWFLRIQMTKFKIILKESHSVLISCFWRTFCSVSKDTDQAVNRPYLSWLSIPGLTCYGSNHLKIKFIPLFGTHHG